MRIDVVAAQAQALRIMIEKLKASRLMVLLAERERIGGQ